MPKLSIITVNYNNLQGLKKTVKSVLVQIFTDFEFILVDGGSHDGSKEFIKAHANHFSFWVSEKDNGVYDAMNKGIQQANGDYLLFLNSGDYLTDNNALNKVFSIHSSKDIIYCDLFWEIDGQRIYQPYPDVLSFEHFIVKELPHQASFIRRELFSRLGLYDDAYRIIADWKFFILAVLKYNCSCEHIEYPVSVCDRKGISCDPLNAKTIKRGRNEIINRYFSVFLNDYEILIKTRKDLVCLQNELSELKMNFGFRMHNRIKRIIKGGN
jgi:glycosyltransferase involved in cell wall biosynthesis